MTDMTHADAIEILRKIEDGTCPRVTLAERSSAIATAIAALSAPKSTYNFVGGSGEKLKGCDAPIHFGDDGDVWVRRLQPIEGLREALYIGDRCLIQMKFTSRDVKKEVKDASVVAHETLLNAARRYLELSEGM